MLEEYSIANKKLRIIAHIHIIWQANWKQLPCSVLVVCHIRLPLNSHTLIVLKHSIN